MELPHDHAHDHGHSARRLMADMPKTESFETVSELIKLMADPKRLQLFFLLCHCEECVLDLSVLTGLSSPAVSHHLRLLKKAGLVVSRREGKEVRYTAADTPRAGVLHEMAEALFEISCPTEPMPHHHSSDSQISTVTRIHALLTADLTRRYTIEELCAQFHMNPTTLKTEFKRVFGAPVAAYMKQYRIRRAAQLLKQTDLPIAAIAAAVGYENGSKFTQAFRAVTGSLPRDYRRQQEDGIISSPDGAIFDDKGHFL